MKSRNKNEEIISVAILTISDKASAGKRKDESGPLIKFKVQSFHHGGSPPAVGHGASGMTKFKVKYYEIIPDDKKIIVNRLKKLADRLKIDLILTTGGTGLSPRDVTPEATRVVIEKEVPGIPEAMRIKTLKFTPKTMLSRSVAGIRGKTFIVNLPGSSTAVKECLGIILPVLSHAVELLSGRRVECGRQ